MSYRTIATFTRCSTFKFEASDQIEDTVVCLKLQFKNTPTVWASKVFSELSNNGFNESSNWKELLNKGFRTWVFIFRTGVCNSMPL